MFNLLRLSKEWNERNAYKTKQRYETFHMQKYFNQNVPGYRHALIEVNYLME